MGRKTDSNSFPPQLCLDGSDSRNIAWSRKSRTDILFRAGNFAASIWGSDPKRHKLAAFHCSQWAATTHNQVRSLFLQLFSHLQIFLLSLCRKIFKTSYFFSCNRHSHMYYALETRLLKGFDCGVQKFAPDWDCSPSGQIDTDLLTLNALLGALGFFQDLAIL